MLLSFLSVRIIVNNTDIYPLLHNSPVVIPVMISQSTIVATDGFHYTKPLKLKYDQPSYYRFRLTCAIDDLQLLGGGFFLVLLYLLGFWTGLLWLKLLSFGPIGWLLFTYYVNRHNFIRLVPSK